MRHRIILLSLLGLLPVLAGCDPSTRHAEASDEAEIDPVVLTLFTPRLELFMEYPRLIVGESARFLAHLTVLATGEPIRSGSLVLEATPPGKPPTILRVDRPARDGLFTPEGPFPVAGEYVLRLILESPQGSETIDAGQLVVHLDEASARRAAEADVGVDPPDAVPFLLESQWKIPLQMEQVSRRALVRRVQVPGEIQPLQGASAVVSPPVDGRLTLPPAGRLPHIGERVRAGQVLALIEPPLPVTQQIQSLGIELSLRSFDLEMNRLEAERALELSITRVDFAERAHARLVALRAKELGTRQDLEAAEQDLRVAQSERASAATMKASVDRAGASLDELRTQSERGLTTEAHRFPLVSPISGVVVSARYVEGEHVEAHAETFRVIDTERVLLVARVSEFDLADVPSEPSAILSLPADPAWRIEIPGVDGGRWLGIGRVVDPETRTVEIRYELPNPEGLLRVGMFADVQLETESVETAIAIPKEAIVIDRGQSVVFVLVHGEMFQRREVSVGIRDGGFVEIESGLIEGERVVTNGAYVVKLASLSPASFGHGHAH